MEPPIFMKKNLFVLSLIGCLIFSVTGYLIFFAFQSKAGAKPSDREKMQLKGKVKRLEIPSPNGGLKDVYLFNEAGNITGQLSVYKDDDREFTKLVNTYDKSGRKISAETYREGKLEKKTIFNYDDTGNNTQELEYNAAGKMVSEITKKYDAQGNLLELFGKPAAPEGSDRRPFQENLDYREFYKYDEYGNIIEKQTFWGDVPTPLDRRLLIYDRKNQLTEETGFSPTYPNKPPRISKHFYLYNEQGDPVETRYYEPVNETNAEEIKGRFEIIDGQGTVKNGVLISDKPYMILWTVTVCEFEYDAQGNWTSQTCRWKMRESAEFGPLSETPARRLFDYY